LLGCCFFRGPPGGTEGHRRNRGSLREQRPKRGQSAVEETEDRGPYRGQRVIEGEKGCRGGSGQTEGCRGAKGHRGPQR
jgi:hypothetical protein